MIATFLVELFSLTVIRLRWCDAPSEYGPPKTLYSRWKRRGDMGVFAKIIMELAEQAPDNKNLNPLSSKLRFDCRAVDATYLKAHRTASSLELKKGGVDV